MFPRLGVNVDHIATLRQARGTTYPDPVAAALLAEQAGADQITIHHRGRRDLRADLVLIDHRLDLVHRVDREAVAFERFGDIVAGQVILRMTGNSDVVVIDDNLDATYAET